MPLPFRERRMRPFRGRERTLDARTHARALANLSGQRRLFLPAWTLPADDVAEIRARHTAVTVSLTPDWIWPRWLAEQSDPTSPSFQHTGRVPSVANVTRRSWTRVGTLGVPQSAIVDRDGLVTPSQDGPSLDWWVRDANGWRYPGREDALEQNLVDAAPVVRTTLPVQGGAVVQHVYGVAGDPSAVIVELANETDAPVAVAFAVRPYNQEGIAVVAALEVVGGVLSVNGEVFGSLVDASPQSVLLSTHEHGDVAHRLTRPDSGVGAAAATIADPTGLATGAVVCALPRVSTVRMALPLFSTAGGTSGGRPATVPDAASVARGWQRHTDGVANFVLPDESATEACAAQPRHLLLLRYAGDAGVPQDALPGLGFVLRALGQLGMPRAVADVLSGIPDRQRQHRFLLGRESHWDALASAVLALADHWRLTQDADIVDELFEVVDLLVDQVRLTAAPGLSPRSGTPAWLGPPGAYFWDGFFCVRALREARALAGVVGDERAARRAREAGDELWGLLDEALDDRAHLCGGVLPAGPDRGADAGMVASLVGCYPLAVLSPDDPRIKATCARLLDSNCRDGYYFHPIAHDGFSTMLTTLLAGCLLLAGDARGWDLVAGLLAVASGTWTWPEAVHPRTGSGCYGSGHDAWAAAAIVTLLRDLCVREVEDGLALCTFIPAAWRSKRLAVDGAPTHHGALDLELTWEGDDAVLRWQGSWTGPSPRLTAPGLDPDWSSTEDSGVVTLRAQGQGADGDS